mmetsp:Transcript_8754/g.17086  ORF Transcript_8754/g.17086 Transcript_8754/m.17086 type:complete len:246 (+) Transcript_8754:522-1259(+)
MEILQSSAIKLHGGVVGNYSMYKQYLFARLISYIVAALSTSSMILAIYAGEVGYGVLTNCLAMSCPFVLYSSYQNKKCAIVMLRMQNMIGFVSVVIFLIINSIMLSERVRNYRYCYGDLEDYCTEDSDDSGYLDCRDEFDSTIENNDKLNEVDCPDRELEGIFIAAIVLNLLACIMLAPYLMVTSTIRFNLHQQHLSGADLPEEFSICAREGVTLLKIGWPIPSDSEFSCTACPIEGAKLLDEEE